jgi:hypothetical protein
MDGENGVADLDLFATTQAHMTNPPPIYKSAVGAIGVYQIQAITPPFESCVVTRSSLIRDRDVAQATPSKGK